MRQIFRIISHKFDLLSQYDCYQDHFISGGGNAGDFEPARENVACLERDYLGVGMMCDGMSIPQIR